MARGAGTAAAVADAIGRASARPIQAATGGKGGEAFLVVGVILLGWLFVSRRLQGVIGVITSPADALPGSAPGGAPAPSGGPPVLPPAGVDWRGALPGSVQDRIRQAEERRRRQERPTDPILDDTPVPGSPGTRPGGTWRPQWGRFF